MVIESIHCYQSLSLLLLLAFSARTRHSTFCLRASLPIRGLLIFAICHKRMYRHIVSKYRFLHSRPCCCSSFCWFLPSLLLGLAPSTIIFHNHGCPSSSYAFREISLPLYSRYWPLLVSLLSLLFNIDVALIVTLHNGLAIPFDLPPMPAAPIIESARDSISYPLTNMRAKLDVDIRRRAPFPEASYAKPSCRNCRRNA